MTLLWIGLALPSDHRSYSGLVSSCSRATPTVAPVRAAKRRRSA